MRPGRLTLLVFLTVLVSGCTRTVRVSWTPQPLAVTLEPNAFRAYEASLRAPVGIASLDLIPSADLRPLVSVVPQTVANVEADTSRRIRLGILLPPTVRPGQRITGHLSGLEIVVDVNPPTAGGALESLRTALDEGNDAAYLAQFAPTRVAEARRTLATFTDTARLALSQTLQTAERIAVDGDTAEYRVTLLLHGQRVESSIVLQRSPDGIWRVIRF